VDDVGAARQVLQDLDLAPDLLLLDGLQDLDDAAGVARDADALVVVVGSWVVAAVGKGWCLRECTWRRRAPLKARCSSYSSSLPLRSTPPLGQPLSTPPRSPPSKPNGLKPTQPQTNHKPLQSTTTQRSSEPHLEHLGVLAAPDLAHDLVPLLVVPRHVEVLVVPVLWGPGASVAAVGRAGALGCGGMRAGGGGGGGGGAARCGGERLDG